MAITLAAFGSAWSAFPQLRQTIIPQLKQDLRPLSLAIEDNGNSSPTVYANAIDSYANEIVQSASTNASTFEQAAGTGL